MSSGTDGPRNTFQLIFHPEFGSALAGKVILVTSFWAQTMLLVLLAFERTHSSTWAGAVTAAQLLPQLCLAVLSGSMTDRFGPQRPIVLGGICTALGCLGLSVWLANPQTSSMISVQVPLLGASVICGVGVALASAAIQAVPPHLSTVEERHAAMALNFLPSALARTIGPVAGTSLSVLIGPVPTLVVIGVMCLLASCIFLFIRRLGIPGKPTSKPSRMIDLLSHIRKDKLIIAALAAVAAIGFGSEAAITLAPSIGLLLDIGTSGAGWVTGAFGAGGLVGVVTFRIATRFLSAPVVGCYAMLLLAIAMAGLGFAPSLAISTTLLVMGGAGMVMGITGFSILAQQQAPAEYLGRVMALWVMAFSGVRPFAGILLGATSDRFSTPAALWGAGLITSLAAAVIVIAIVKVRDVER